MKVALQVAGIGMVTAAGKTAAETASAVARGVRSVQETSIVGAGGVPLSAALALPITPAQTGLARALALASPALAECLTQAGRTSLPSTALLICIPSPTPPLLSPGLGAGSKQRDIRTGWARLPATLAAESVQVYGLPVHELVSFEEGRVAGVLALRRAAELIESGAVDQCVVGGVEIAGEHAILGRLDFLGQLRTARNPHARIPGEAAAFLCLRRAAEAPADRVACVVAASTAEQSMLTAESSTETPGLASAALDALRHWGGRPSEIALLAVDVDAGRERLREAIRAITVALWRQGPTLKVVPPSECLGDVGAATVPLLVGLAAKWLLDRPPGRAAMVACGSDKRLRGAAIVTTTSAMSPLS